jgi:putative ABC transport system permease protein
MKFLPLVWSGIWRKPGRTLLAMLQIVVAFALFGVLQGFSTGVKYAMAHTSADSLWVHSRGSFSDLPLGHYERMKKVPGVRRVSYRNYIGARYQNPKQQLLIIAAEPYDWMATTDDVTIAPADVDALARTRTGAIVGRVLANKYGWKIGQRIPLQTDVAQKNGSKVWTFDIVGFLEHTDPARRNQSTIMLVNYSYYDEARVADNGMVHQYTVQVADPKRVGEVADAIDNAFANSAYETRSETWREAAQSQFKSLGDLDFVVHAITAAALFSLLFSIGATLMQSVRERTPELATLKAVGFTDAAVVAIVVAEAGFVALVSAMLGLGVAMAIFWAATRYNILSGHLTIPTDVLITGGVLAVLLALASGFLPALRGMRLQVAEALADR